MSNTAPSVDPRDASQIAAIVTANLHANVPEWSATDPATGEPDQASAALISIISRFGEVVIERLNQAPDKNFLAFLDLLGTTPLPPGAARVPLTFTVAAGSVTDAVVPAGTQVAAAPAEGEKTPVVFETERELTAVAATLQTLIAVDAERDLLADYSALLTTPAVNGVRVFAGDRPNEHVLYIAQGAYLSNALLATLTLNVQLTADSPVATDARVLQWEAWDGASGIPLTVTDATQGFAVSGAVSFTNVVQVPEQTVNGIRSRWLRCRLLTPVSTGATPAQGMVRAAQLPLLADLRVTAALRRTAFAPDVAFANTQAVDVSRAFLPFGEKPRIGDTFYLGSREALGQPGGTITVDVSLANPIGTPGSIKPTTPSTDLQLKWDVWNGVSWQLLGVTTPQGSTGGSLVDNGNAFTSSSTVTFTLPQVLASTTVNGVESNWVRVQIAQGNYGVEADYVADPQQPGGFRLVLATFAPPVVSTLAVSYATTTPAVPLDAIIGFNTAQFEDLGSDLAAGRASPFESVPSQPAALYAAFTLPPARTRFPNRSVSLYHGVRLPPYGERTTPLSPEFSPQVADAGTTFVHRYTLTNASSGSSTFDLATFGGAWPSTVAPSRVKLLPGLSTEVQVSVVVPAADQLPGANASDRGFLTLRDSSTTAVHSAAFETRVGVVAPRRRELRFEYWNGTTWAKLVASDGTDLLAHPGIVEFLGPADIAPSRKFGVNGYWIRALFESGDDTPVQLRTLLPNTTFAEQAVTLRNDVLGSSDASVSQQFRTTRSPVLASPRLEVRESGPPSTDELAALTVAGESVLTPTAGNSSEVWVRWLEVTDFHSSAPQDRHYILDHIAGIVRFGDGAQGRIPPRGPGNIRMARYRTGGGAGGNSAAGTIVQLKTTVPYIERVVNMEAAEGGVAAESNAALVSRAPRALRHGGRAVALEDYEDLARAASPEVARAKTVPLRQLRDDPLSNLQAPGAVSVVIVPLSASAKPLPSAGLITLVENSLRGAITPTATLTVVGPLYVRVDVTIEIALVALEGASQVEDAAREALRAFLHPLTGGRDGTGWDFGRQPHLSDLYAVVSDVPGVDHVRQLSINQVEEPTGALATERFLVYSGQHQVTLTFVGAE
ncbi:MAG: putative baseplate assembly protein [bacterium]